MHRPPGIHLKYTQTEMVNAMQYAHGIDHLALDGKQEWCELLTYLIAYLDLRIVQLGKCKVIGEHVHFELLCKREEASYFDFNHRRENQWYDFAAFEAAVRKLQTHIRDAGQNPLPGGNP
jgi:hypothetical protein